MWLLVVIGCMALKPLLIITRLEFLSLEYIRTSGLKILLVNMHLGKVVNFKISKLWNIPWLVMRYL